MNTDTKNELLIQLARDARAFLPDAKKNEDGSYSVVIIHEPEEDDEKSNGSTIFRFSEIERFRRTQCDAFVEVVVHHGGKIKQMSCRLNLASSSAKDGLVRSLARMVGGKKEFDSHFSNAVEALYAKLDAIPRSESVIEIEPITGNMMLFHPFITDKSANLVFGDGSSTKSYICIHLAISLVTGLPFAGFKPARKINVLFLDFEDVGGKFSDRVNRVASGMPVSPEIEDLRNLRYMQARGTPLHDMVNSIKEEVTKHKIELLVVDSVGAATPQQRAAALVAKMSETEKLSLVRGYLGPYVGNVNPILNLSIPALTLEDGPREFLPFG